MTVEVQHQTPKSGISPGLVGVKVTLTADAYVNGTGYTVDVTGTNGNIMWEQVHDGLTDANASHGDVVYVTKSATVPWRFNVKLYTSGGVERANGNVTGVIYIRLRPFRAII